jgi:antitoxin component YwqK of YwqJK toxin-antitoxin module
MIEGKEYEVYKTYYSNGNIFREAHCVNRVLHKEDGPAQIIYYENGGVKSKTYYIYCRLHREDGPAHISYFPNGNIKSKEYWLDAKNLTEEEWFDQLSTDNKLKIAFGINNG